MNRLQGLMLGFGDIGTAVHSLFKHVINFEIIDPKRKMVAKIDRTRYDIIVVTYPYHDGFIEEINDLAIKYSAFDIMIFSTLPIGITKQITGAVHIPVEGKHPGLDRYIRSWRLFIGHNGNISEKIMHCLNNIGNNYTLVRDSNVTEALKLLSTTCYGINIEFARLVGEVFQTLRSDYSLWNEYTSAYNLLYSNTNEFKSIKRYNLYAPRGPIGGHCIVSNAKLLGKSFKSPIIDIVKGEQYES